MTERNYQNQSMQFFVTARNFIHLILKLLPDFIKPNYYFCEMIFLVYWKKVCLH